MSNKNAGSVTIPRDLATKIWSSLYRDAGYPKATTAESERMELHDVLDAYINPNDPNSAAIIKRIEE